MANDDAKIQTDRFKPAESTLGKWDAKTETGVTREQLLKPEYWSHVSELMTPWSEITARCEDGTYYAKLLVLDCGRGWAKVQVLAWHSLTTADVAQSQSSAGTADDYDIIWKGASLKHIIQRKSDQVVIHQGEQRKDGAKVWLDEYLSSKAHVDRKIEYAPD